MSLLRIGNAANFHLFLLMKNTKSKSVKTAAPQVKIVKKIVYVDRPVDRPVVIELTSKKYKGVILFSNVLFVFAIFLFFFSFSGSFDPTIGIGFAIMIAGVSVVMNVIGHFLAWWNNG